MGLPEKKPKIVPKIDKKKGISLNSHTQEIESRRTAELVIALCGAVGAGVTTVADEIEKRFKTASYTISRIKISDLITEKYPITNVMSRYERISSLQKTGTDLREKFGNDYLAQLAVKKIVGDRTAFTAQELEKKLRMYNILMLVEKEGILQL